MLRPARVCLLICAVAALQPGCSAPSTVPDRTVMLREVAQVLTRQEILASAWAPSIDTVPPMFPMFSDLLAVGTQQVDMVDGSVILGRTHFYRTATSTSAISEHICWSTVARGVDVRAGNIVEVEQRGLLTTVVRIKYQNLAEGGCVYRTDSGQTVGTTSGDIRSVGDEGSASLHCAGLAEQGWLPARRSFYGLFYGTEWRKPPPVGQSSDASTPSGQSMISPCNIRRVP